MGLSVFYEGCKTPFHPKLKEGNGKELVVEGFINGNGITTITISRTREITPLDTADRKYELHANVIVQDNMGNVCPLYEAGLGQYRNSMSLTQDEQYRLHISTADGKEYVSSYVPLRVSPPIDDLAYKREGNKVDILLNTHDPLDKSTYYRWDYSETWEYHSEYESHFKYNPVDTTVVPRQDKDSVHICWITKPSSNIMLATTSGLAEDKLEGQTIQTIYKDNDRLSVLYSILVNQYVVDSSAYAYWLMMQKYSEDLGGLFDPQPTGNIKGNLTCVSDTTEHVIGYISAGIASSQRMFVPKQWDIYVYPDTCLIRVVPLIKDSFRVYFGQWGDVPFEPVKSGLNIIAWNSAYRYCVDCTSKGGITVKPFFWP